MRKLGYLIVAIALVAATATNASAAAAAVPEISPNSLAAGLGLLAGGVLILRARLKK